MGFRGDRLNQFRKEHGMSQSELAEKLGLDQNQISRYERGVISPSYDSLKHMARMFDTTADYLIGLTDDPSPSTTRSLTEHEAELINLIHYADERLQARVVETVRFLWRTWVQDGD